MGPLGAFLAGWQLAQIIDKTWIRPVDPLADRAKAIGFVDKPRAEEGSPIPLFYGRVRVNGANCILAGNLASRPIVADSGDLADITEGPVFLGYLYAMTMLFSVGIPGANKSTLKKVWVGERLAWSGSISSHTDERFVNKPNLLGGLGAGGGVGGILGYMPGTFEQLLPDLLRGALEEAGVDLDLQPDYRGEAVVALYNTPFGLGSGWVLGENPRLDHYSFEVQAKTLQPDDMPTLNSIGDGDANPACVLYDLLTGGRGRCGLDAGLIDLDSFIAVGETLQTEEHGISLWAAASTTARDLIRLILSQINGVLYVDATDGKYHLSLIRDDYDPEDLPVFDRDNIVEVADYGTSTWAQVPNQVLVRYTQRSKGYKDSEALIHDSSLIARYGLRAVEFHYPGCTTAALAAKLASRDLRVASLPLAACRIIVNRDAFEMPPAGLFVLNMTGVPGWDNYTATVFRIFNVNLGAPGSEQIVLECAQDQFAFDYVPHPGLDWDTLPLPVATPITVRLVEEAPRWLQRAASAAALLGGPDEQHLHYLAEKPSTDTIGYQGRVSMDGGTSYVDDTPRGPFPMTGRLVDPVSRFDEPYDTTVGLLVAMENGAVPTAVDDTLIPEGRGLIYVVPVDDAGSPVVGEGEFMSYETSTAEGDNYRLESIWRADLDTAARAHVAGEIVFFLNINYTANSGLGRFGGQWHDLDEVLVSRIRAISGFAASDPSGAAYRETTTIRLRHELPYPPANLQIAGDRLPVSLTTEGEAGVGWARRDRLKTTITRGDAASEEVDAETTYVVRATKDVDGSPATNGTTDLVEGLTDEDASAELALAAAGYGPLDVSVQARREFTTEAGADVVLRSWQEPALRVNAPEWRQLLINPTLGGLTLAHWTINTGSPVILDDGDGHVWINASGYAGDWEVEQVVDVRGYQPARLSAVLQFLAQNAAVDGNDVITVTVESLDVDLNVLDSGDNGGQVYATASATRDKATIVSLDPDTVYLRVTVHSDYNGSAADAKVGDFVLRLGQMDQALSNLLANADLEAGTFTNWTNDDNSFVADTTAPLHTLTRYALPGSFATSQIGQAITPAAGYEVGAFAVLRVARANLAVSAWTPGEVVIQALTSGAVVSWGETTGMEVIDPADTWVMRQLVLELPSDTATVKTSLKGTQTAKAAPDTAFDDLHLMIWKKLDPSQMWEYRYDAPPVQLMPRDRVLWALAFPDVPAPNYGWWIGDSWQGSLGTEADMEAEDDADAMIVEAPFVGLWDGETAVCNALECYKRTHSIRTETNTNYANFDSGQSFTVRVVFKAADLTGTQNASLAGRHAGVYDAPVMAVDLGWHLTLRGDGIVQATICGTTGVPYLEDAGSTCNRVPQYAAIVYDAGAAQLRLITPFGAQSTSTAGAGEFGVLGENLTFADNFLGQIASVEIWDEAIPSADLQAMWTFGSNPSDAGTTQTLSRNAESSTPIGYDAGFGARVTAYAYDQFPIGWSSVADDDGGTGFGLAGSAAADNKVPVTAQSSQTPWTTSGATVTFNAAPGVEGLRDAITITGDNTQYLQLGGILIGAGANNRSVWYARADVAHTARARLYNTSGVLNETRNFAVTTEWVRIPDQWSLWDNSTANADLRFYGSSTGTPGTIQICGPFYFGEGTEDPYLTPSPVFAEAGADLVIADNFGAAPLLANEGEIEWTGVFTKTTPDGSPEILILKNASSTDNGRYLAVDGGAPSFNHLDGASGAVQADGAIDATWNALHTIRGRWCRAGLLDAAAAFTTVINGNALDADMDIGRVAAWTPDATAMQELRVGAINGLVRVVRVYTRESRLPLVTP